MIKFIHQKRVQLEKKDNIIIFYKFSDIFLGTILLILTVFFIHDYLSHALNPYGNVLYMNQAYQNQLRAGPI